MHGSIDAYIRTLTVIRDNIASIHARFALDDLIDVVQGAASPIVRRCVREVTGWGGVRSVTEYCRRCRALRDEVISISRDEVDDLIFHIDIS